VSEAEIAVHWQEEDYIRPPKAFTAQANLKDAAIFAPCVASRVMASLSEAMIIKLGEE
jgi:hypothetical protein